MPSHKAPCLAVLLGAILALACAASDAATVRFDPPTQTANPGDMFSLNLVGEGFADIVDGGGVNIAFNPSVVHVTNVSIDTGVWDFFTSVGAIDNTLGTVSDIVFNALQNVSGNFAIATIQFQAVGLGGSALALTESSANPFASGGDPLAVTLVNGSARVPEPASWLLLSSGFALLWPRGKKS